MGGWGGGGGGDPIKMIKYTEQKQNGSMTEFSGYKIRANTARYCGRHEGGVSDWACVEQGRN